MADFKETLEVSKNSTCFLSYSFCKTKEDLAVDETLDIEFSDSATLGEVADLIERFSQNEQQCFETLQTLRDTGKVVMEDEY